MKAGQFRVAAAATVFYTIVAGFSILHQNGIVGVTRKTTGVGCVCHDPSPTDMVLVRVVGPDSVRIGSHQLFALTIRGGPAVAGGFDLAAGSGALSVIDDSVQLENGELTHMSPRLFTGDSVRWIFSYAPSATASLDTLFPVGNSVNLNGLPSGDQWNFGANFIIRVLPETTLSVQPERTIRAFHLYQNFPNPFNPETRLSFVLPDGDGRSRALLRVFDLLGRDVATLLDETMEAGYHEVRWEGGSYGGGIYFARLEVTPEGGDPSGRQRTNLEVIKMVLLR